MGTECFYVDDYLDVKRPHTCHTHAFKQKYLHIQYSTTTEHVHLLSRIRAFSQWNCERREGMGGGCRGRRKAVESCRRRSEEEKKKKKRKRELMCPPDIRVHHLVCYSVRMLIVRLSDREKGKE